MTDTTHEAPELLPCPFCGGKAEHSVGRLGDNKPWHYVECGECGATGPNLNYADHNISVIQFRAEGWNTRSADLIAAHVAAALREAINRVNGCDRVSEVQPAILALIPDGGAALDRVVAAERERCAKVAESVALPMGGKITKAQAGYMRDVIAQHIRKGGE